jgi:hypothetical protein
VVVEDRSRSVLFGQEQHAAMDERQSRDEEVAPLRRPNRSELATDGVTPVRTNIQVMTLLVNHHQQQPSSLSRQVKRHCK